MPPLLNIILTTVAPIILIAGLGAALDRFKRIDARSLSGVIIYLGSPALAFYTMANSSITKDELASLLLFSVLVLVIITGLGWLVSRGLKMDRLTSSAFVLSVSLINGINYGAPLAEFAFGQAGLERAILIGVIFALYAYTSGIFLASWGKAPLWQAVKNVFIVPTPYAAFLGLAINMTDTPVPMLVLRLTQVLGSLAIPLMLVILGIQMSRTSLDGQWGLMLGASAIRLIGGAAVGFLLALWLGLGGATRQAAIIEAAM
ncbi:MAG: AEC family transporter, partial [Chloroflexota bacterium]